MIDFADRLKEFPKSEGGWLLRDYGKLQYKIMDKQLVLSNSFQGFGRTSLTTMTRNVSQSMNDKTAGFFQKAFGSKK
jgi:hypothetical protein